VPSFATSLLLTGMPCWATKNNQLKNAMPRLATENGFPENIHDYMKI